VKNTDYQYITVIGAKTHNLKNISVKIPRNKITVITGPSGSGKSSLAFDTLFAEGQRRFVECLSSYARQFLNKMPPPEVDSIDGIPPAIAIEQKIVIKNVTSTVGTITEIYDYLKLLYAKIGVTFSPLSNKEVKHHNEKDIVDYIIKNAENKNALILVPIIIGDDRDLKTQLEVYQSQGYGKCLIDNTFYKITDIIGDTEKINPDLSEQNIFLVIDRIFVEKEDKDIISRISESANTAYFEGDGKCVVQILDEISNIISEEKFSNLFEADGMLFEKPDINLFSFNNPYGACPTCKGFGTVLGIDEDLVIPDKTLSVYEGAIACWKGEKLSQWKDDLILKSHKINFPIHKPYNQLNKKEIDLLWNTTEAFYGINYFFKVVESQVYKIQYRVLLSRYRGKTICPECAGSRLKKEAGYVKIHNTSILDLLCIPIDELVEFFNNIKLSDLQKQIAERTLEEIRYRLHFLTQVGLGYLTLNRASNTLSGGETQRINLAQSVGNKLVGALYIIDEPTVGLHPKDTHKLINTLVQLKKLGNTIVIVEHDEEIIKIADYIIDIGPLAGSRGGEIVFTGNFKELVSKGDTLTAKYFQNILNLATPHYRRKWRNYIEIIGAKENNLQNQNFKFPLNTLTIITGPSGSGKTTIIKKILYPAIKKLRGGIADKTGKFDNLQGDIHLITNIELVDQNPIGKSSRSNPATYIKAFDYIRELYSMVPASKAQGYKPGFFSFNSVGGRCENCRGEGSITINMQFLADVKIICDSCNGNRYKDEALDIKFNNKNINDILNMTIDDTLTFFRSVNNGKYKTAINHIIDKLTPLSDIGLGYLNTGQSTSTLSGGESQRLKLASYLLSGSNSKHILFIFDEPSTGLHYNDIIKLNVAFERLINKGHSIIVVEHNMEIIKCADWIIDLGPDGGKNGGKIIFEGTPEDMIKNCKSHTVEFLKKKFKN